MSEHEHDFRLADGGFLLNHVTLPNPPYRVAVLERCTGCDETRVVVEQLAAPGKVRRFCFESMTLDDLQEILRAIRSETA